MVNLLMALRALMVTAKTVNAMQVLPTHSMPMVSVPDLTFCREFVYLEEVYLTMPCLCGVCLGINRSSRAKMPALT